MMSKEASVMPIWVFAESDPAPWTACHWGVTSHPHYHDFERKQNEAFRARAKEIINSLPPYPSLDPKRLP